MIEYLKLLLDFGLVVLVWTVQLAIYPGFRYFQTSDLKIWHPKYSRGISFIVAPLMLGQLGMSIYFLGLNVTSYTIGNLVLVLVTWVITFGWAIPLHKAIDQKAEFSVEVESLIKINRLRALTWTIILLWTIGLLTM